MKKENELLNDDNIEKYLQYKYNIFISEICFEWDKNKNKTNISKHKVSFAEASTVFYDDNAILFDDPAHSEYEERFLIIGMSNRLTVLTVVHCLRENETIIRIISARKATESESNYYWNQINGGKNK